MANNTQQWSSATPGLLIILLDQSGSMLQQYEGSDSRTVFASRAVNRVIDYIVRMNFNTDAPKNRCFIFVIGYNHNVNDLCSGWLKDIAAKPLRYVDLKKKMPDGEGGFVEVDICRPVWVEPAKGDGEANMLGAFKLAKELVQEWISDNPQYPAPVIINISDGVPYYDGKDPRECMKETTELAKEIMSLSNEDGNVLVYNVHIDESRSDTIVFPDDRNKLEQEEAQFLFDISSEVPASFFSFINERYPYGIQESCGVGSRCYVRNLTPSHLISIIPSFVFGAASFNYFIDKINSTNYGLSEER